MKFVIAGTAGHIDHGKSALVEALTGTNPDRLEEEKRRGITLDLGFAFLDLGDIRLGLVDVPGHERFVRNMLAGVGGIDLVLLVIAADESIKPQTREHFDICRLLSIPRGIVALTKCDLVDPDTLELVRLELEEFLRGSFLEGAPVVPVSSKTGAGLGRLKQELAQVALEVPPKDPSRYFRLPIDRAFAMKGFGTVVTGTLISGEVKPEDELELFPARRRLRVRGVQSGGQAVARAIAGQRTALNLAGIDLEQLARGMVLAAPGRFEPTKRLDARLTLLASARRMKNRTRVHFHQGTAETIAEVVLLDAMELSPGSTALAQLCLDDPVLVLPGDRFILRQFSPVVTIGGGVVLDALPQRRRQRDVPQAISCLKTIERGNHEEILAALAANSPQGIESGQVVARLGWLEKEVRDIGADLVHAGTLVIASEQPWVVVSKAKLQEVAQSVAASVDEFHRANSLVEGVSKEELRSRAAAGVRPEVFRAALAELIASGRVAVSGDLVKRAGRAIALLPEEAAAKELIEQEFLRADLRVPTLKEILAKLPVGPARAQKLVQLLLREQTLVKVSEELVFHREALARLRALLAEHKKSKGERLPVAAFKELTGISRKYAIPLLEYLDREHVTRRVGDERVIL